MLVVGIVQMGSARVLASNATGIICTALLVDYGHNTPTSMTNLTLAKHPNPVLAAVCGLGAELVLVVPAVFWLRGWARRRRAGHS
jgi:hypothetical protein